MSQQEKNVILVVDDDIDVAEMVSAYLSRHGYVVRTVGMGEAAVQQAMVDPPDLVIQDINLPDIDGFEVAYRLRNNRKTRDIPIIFLTEKQTRSDRIQGLELGADDYITKPFDMPELKLRVRNAINRTEQGTLTSPVTGLPEGVLVDDRLEECLHSDQWTLILVSLENLSRFREHYGFVAADDVLRAMSLMVHNAIREAGGVNDFVGHFSEDAFVLVTSMQYRDELAERIKTRIEQSLEYFYPLKDRERKRSMPARLAVHLRTFTAGRDQITNLADLKKKLTEASMLE